VQRLSVYDNTHDTYLGAIIISSSCVAYITSKIRSMSTDHYAVVVPRLSVLAILLHYPYVTHGEKSFKILSVDCRLSG